MTEMHLLQWLPELQEAGGTPPRALEGRRPAHTRMAGPQLQNPGTHYRRLTPPPAYGAVLQLPRKTNSILKKGSKAL